MPGRSGTAGSAAPTDHNACFCGRSNKAAISHMANEGLAQWAQLGHETQKETRAMEQKSHTLKFFLLFALFHEKVWQLVHV